MPLKFFKNRLLPIGIDLGSSRLKMAQLRMGEQEAFELIAADSIEIPAELLGNFSQQIDFLAQNIRRSLISNGFQGRQCILCLPACHTSLQHVRIPRVSDREMDRLLRAELEGKLPFGAQEAVISYVVAGEVLGGEDQNKQEVIVAAAARETIEAYLEMAAKARLDVVGINVESCAVVECFARLFRRNGDAERANMFIDLGAASTQVSLTHGDRLVFARNLMQGEMQFDQAIAQGMSMTVEQAHSLRWDLQKGSGEGQAQEEVYRHLTAPLDNLASEIMQCLRYYESVFRSQPVERMILVGGQAFDKRLCQSLAQRLNLPAQIGDPLIRIQRIGGAGMHIGLDRRDPQPQWAVAVGLSIGAAPRRSA